MTYRYVEIFLAVVEYGKMSEAAKRLFITQSSVSQAIAAIEKEYGILLFERFSHSLRLTDEGRGLYAYARNLVAARKDMDEFLSNSARSRRLRVGATVTVGTCVISPILRELREAWPMTEISVFISNTSAIEKQLLDNLLDVALVEGIVKSPDIVSEPVFCDRLVLIGSPGHRFSGRSTVDCRELPGEPMILREQGSGTRLLFEEQMKRIGCPIRVTWECSNAEAIKNAVRDGHGLSVISARLVRRELDEGSLWACDVSGVELSRYFSIVYHKNKYLSESLEQFIGQCRNSAERENSRALP